jgi:hypothetical protein
MNQVVIILIIAAIGLAFGLIIYLANAKLPYRVKNIDRIEAIKKALYQKAASNDISYPSTANPGVGSPADNHRPLYPPSLYR